MKKSVIRITIGLACAVVLVMGLNALWQAGLQSDLDEAAAQWAQAVAKFEAAGGVVDPVTALPGPVPDADNGVLQYIEAYWLGDAQPTFSDVFTQERIPFLVENDIRSTDLAGPDDAPLSNIGVVASGQLDKYEWPNSLDPFLPLLHETVDWCTQASLKPHRIWNGVQHVRSFDIKGVLMAVRVTPMNAHMRIMRRLEMHVIWNLNHGTDADAYRDLRAMLDLSASYQTDVAPNTSILFAFNADRDVYDLLAHMSARGAVPDSALEGVIRNRDYVAWSRCGISLVRQFDEDVFFVHQELAYEAMSRSEKIHARQSLTEHLKMCTAIAMKCDQTVFPRNRQGTKSTNMPAGLGSGLAAAPLNRLPLMLARQRQFLAACDLHRFHEAHGGLSRAVGMGGAGGSVHG